MITKFIVKNNDINAIKAILVKYMNKSTFYTRRNIFRYCFRKNRLYIHGLDYQGLHNQLHGLLQNYIAI